MPGTAAFIHWWPRITVGGFKRAITRRGLGGGPIPVNTLYAVPQVSSSVAGSSLLATGTDAVLYACGWLDVGRVPQVLHLPEMEGRYHSVQFTDPSSGANFAYVGTRSTGTGAGEYVVCGSRWRGSIPDGMTRISAPHRSVLVIGRVFVANQSDQPAACKLAQRLRLAPLDK